MYGALRIRGLKLKALALGLWMYCSGFISVAGLGFRTVGCNALVLAYRPTQEQSVMRLLLVAVNKYFEKAGGPLTEVIAVRLTLYHGLYCCPPSLFVGSHHVFSVRNRKCLINSCVHAGSTS